MSSHDVERAYVAAVLDARDQQLADLATSTRAELDRLRASWAESYGDEAEASAARIEAMRTEHQAAMSRIINGEAEPATQDPQGQVGASSAGRNAPASGAPGPGQPNVVQQAPWNASGPTGGLPSTPGPGPAGQPNTEITAADIQAMSWPEYAALRARTGIGNARQGMFA